MADEQHMVRPQQEDAGGIDADAFRAQFHMLTSEAQWATRTALEEEIAALQRQLEEIDEQVSNDETLSKEVLQEGEVTHDSDEGTVPDEEVEASSTIVPDVASLEKKTTEPEEAEKLLALQNTLERLQLHGMMEDYRRVIDDEMRIIAFNDKHEHEVKRVAVKLGKEIGNEWLEDLEEIDSGPYMRIGGDNEAVVVPHFPLLSHYQESQAQLLFDCPKGLFKGSHNLNELNITPAILEKRGSKWRIVQKGSISLKERAQADAKDSPTVASEITVPIIEEEEPIDKKNQPEAKNESSPDDPEARLKIIENFFQQIEEGCAFTSDPNFDIVEAKRKAEAILARQDEALQAIDALQKNELVSEFIQKRFSNVKETLSILDQLLKRVDETVEGGGDRFIESEKRNILKNFFGTCSGDIIKTDGFADIVRVKLTYGASEKAAREEKEYFEGHTVVQKLKYALTFADQLLQPNSSLWERMTRKAQNFEYFMSDAERLYQRFKKGSVECLNTYEKFKQKEETTLQEYQNTDRAAYSLIINNFKTLLDFIIMCTCVHIPSGAFDRNGHEKYYEKYTNVFTKEEMAYLKDKVGIEVTEPLGYNYSRNLHEAAKWNDPDTSKCRFIHDVLRPGFDFSDEALGKKSEILSKPEVAIGPSQ